MGFESVDDGAVESSGSESGLRFPSAPLSDGCEIPLAGSSISDSGGDEGVAFSSASGPEPSSLDALEFEECSDEGTPEAESYPGVDMQPWFHTRQPLEEQGQGLLTNAFCFFANLPGHLRLAIGKAAGLAGSSISSLAARCCGLRRRTVAAIVKGVERNGWIPRATMKRPAGRRMRKATQTEDAPGRVAI